MSQTAQQFEAVLAPVFGGRIPVGIRAWDGMLVQQMSRTSRPGGGPFIEAFIAPDMHMRPVGQTVAMIERAGLEVRDVHALREHYVRTVAAWYSTFEEDWSQVVSLVGEEVARVWGCTSWVVRWRSRRVAWASTRSWP